MNSIYSPESLIAIIDSEILRCQAYANYWANYATSKANHLRVVFQGEYQWNEADLERDAFNISLNFIHKIADEMDKKRELLAKIEKRNA